jgi:hypothetical protein
MHEAVEVELEVRGIGVVGQFTVKPAEGLIVELKLTDPVKSSVLEREIVMDVPEAPVFMLPELAEMVKSPM